MDGILQAFANTLIVTISRLGLFYIKGVNLLRVMALDSCQNFRTAQYFKTD